MINEEKDPTQEQVDDQTRNKFPGMVTDPNNNVIPGQEDPIDGDDEELHRAELDDTDEDGDPLNEKSSGSDQSGKDLDVPGAEDDDDNEDIGEEDEENNEYSLPKQ
jgi:hypothetical protein